MAQGIEIRPHDLGCPTLAKIVEHGKTRCTNCNAVLVTERNGQVVYCPNGHTRELSGEAALEFFDTTGSGWIRDELERDDSSDTRGD